jgi:hypothetical protein
VVYFACPPPASPAPIPHVTQTLPNTGGEIVKIAWNATSRSPRIKVFLLLFLQKKKILLVCLNSINHALSLDGDWLTTPVRRGAGWT